MNEIWLDIIEAPPFQISNCGRFRNKNTGYIRKAFVNHNGYLQICPETAYGRVNMRINRLVAQYFLPNPNKLEQVNHKDGNKLNNNVNNLEWVSLQQNIQHSINNKLHLFGEKHGMHKLNEKDVIYIYKNRHVPTKIFMKKYNVTKSCINDIKAKRTWKHLWEKV